jgi:phosphocarrier protein HPr
MAEKKLIIINKLGLHARASAKFVAIANRFSAQIEIIKNNKKVNGKSIMGVMMLAANKGTEITIKAEGEDEHAALVALETLVNNRFGEEQ